MRISKKIFLIILFYNFDVSSQWAFDPSINTPLVINSNDPKNISVQGDSKDGGFIVWQDSVTSNLCNVYFLHFNKEGQVSFRSDGKVISLSPFNKLNPVTDINSNDEVIILWTEIISSEKQTLNIQKVNSIGSRLWGDFGVQLLKIEGEIINYSLSCDNSGTIFISAITKNFSTRQISKNIIRVSSNGKLIDKNEPYKKIVGKIHNTKIISVDSSFAGVFWIEDVNNKTTLNFNSQSFKRKTQEKVKISNPNENVIDFMVKKIGNDFYIVWTVQGKIKKIYHQMISNKGIKKWGDEGKLVTTLQGNNYNPNFAFHRNKILVSFVNEKNKDKNIYAEAFDLNGEKIWKRNPLSIIDIPGDQFGQQVVSAFDGAFIIAWIDRRKNDSLGDIFAQKITLDGKFLWDSLGVDLGTSPNSIKSYLNLVAVKNGGAIAIFKDQRNTKGEIFGQKIYSTGTYAGQILGLKSEIIGDSIKISWYVANEPNIVEYEILCKYEDELYWKSIAKLKKISNNVVNFYQYYDFPDYNGPINYKVIQIIDGKENQQSDISSVNYVTNFDDYVLFQNSPNPFSDKTAISFLIPHSHFVEIEIFDIKLNPIKTLVKEYFNNGKHTVILDANDIQPGIYFYRMKAGNFVSVKKMIVNK